MSSLLTLLSSPLTYWAFAVVAGALATKAPLPTYWEAWATCAAAVFTGIAGLLTNPQHLMTALKVKSE